MISSVAFLDLDGSLSLAAVGTACGGILERCNILGIRSPHRRSGGQALDRSYQVNLRNKGNAESCSNLT
jgi:hypothetical protein